MNNPAVTYVDSRLVAHGWTEEDIRSGVRARMAKDGWRISPGRYIADKAEWSRKNLRLSDLFPPSFEVAGETFHFDGERLTDDAGETIQHFTYPLQIERYLGIYLSEGS